MQVPPYKGVPCRQSVSIGQHVAHQWMVDNFFQNVKVVAKGVSSKYIVVGQEGFCKVSVWNRLWGNRKNLRQEEGHSLAELILGLESNVGPGAIARKEKNIVGQLTKWVIILIPLSARTTNQLTRPAASAQSTSSLKSSCSVSANQSHLSEKDRLRQSLPSSLQLQRGSHKQQLYQTR